MWLALWPRKEEVTDTHETEKGTPSQQTLDAISLIADWRQILDQSVPPLEQEIARLKKEARQRSVLSHNILASLEKFANNGWE